IAVLATIAGVLIVGVGGGLVRPMQQRWEGWLGRMEQEAPAVSERVRVVAAQRAAEAQAAREAEASREAEARRAEEEHRDQDQRVQEPFPGVMEAPTMVVPTVPVLHQQDPHREAPYQEAPQRGTEGQLQVPAQRPAPEDKTVILNPPPPEED